MIAVNILLALGFNQPTVSAVLTPMAGPIPNVITLPFGRDKAAFHLKAPSWRALLKLMARLSGTRLEPALEDLAVIKAEMKLRVVVAFVKVGYFFSSIRSLILHGASLLTMGAHSGSPIVI